MRVVTPQITWHNRDPVLCVDFDPTCLLKKDEGKDNFYRVATGGSDSHLIIWHLREPASIKVDLICVAELTRHTKSVNTVRFSPCGKFLASADDDAYVYIWKCDTEKNKHDEEFWTVEKALRKHIDDVSDLNWSSDGGRLVTTSVDNSAIIWDVKKGTSLYIWSEHGGFVQGVSFDPLGEFVATISTDRTMRLFNPQTGKLERKSLKYPSKWLHKEKEILSKDVVLSPDDNPNFQSKKSLPLICNRLFHDDTLKSFCRRLSFSPKGELLVVPGGILPPTRRDESEKSPNVRKQNGNVSLASASPKLTGNKARRILNNGNTSTKEKPVSDKNAVIVFCRNSFSNPCCVIPTGTSYSIAVRFCPLYFQRNRNPIAYDKCFVNPIKKSERLVTCVGKLNDSRKARKVLLDMPYRVVFAVCTNDSVIISDTESAAPLAVIRNIHLTRMSDLSWSADGRLLIVSSTDGYCSLISFEKNELGVAVVEEVMPPSAEAFPIPPPPPPKQKPVKRSKKRPLKESTEKDIKNKEMKKSEKGLSPASTMKKSEQVLSPASTKKTPTRDIAKFFKGSKGQTPTKISTEMCTDLNGKEVEGDVSYEAGFCNVDMTVTKLPSEANVVEELKTKAVKDENYEQTEAEKEKIAITPKRTTLLDRWLKKTPVSGDSKVSKTTTRKNTPSKVTSLPIVCSPRNSLDTGTKVTAPGESTHSTSVSASTISRPLITPEQIRQLENAPLIIDLEADEAENDASVICSSSDTVVKTGNFIKNKNIPPVEDVATPIMPRAETPTNLSEKMSVREKRQATSPLSSQQRPKQPRRVEFITLPTPKSSVNDDS